MIRQNVWNVFPPHSSGPTINVFDERGFFRRKQLGLNCRIENGGRKSDVSRVRVLIGKLWSITQISATR